MHRIAAAIALSVAFASVASSQNPASPAPAPGTTTALDVFLDCKTHYCDFDFFRQEIAAVNWVRDPGVADVHVIVVSQETGAGGDQLTAHFIGLDQFDGADDTLSFSTRAVAVDDEVRRDLAQMLKVGLVGFVARSSGLDALDIGFTDVRTNDDAVPVNDPWNAWVFRTSVDGETEADRGSKSIESEVELSANRVTGQWKTDISLEGSYDENQFELNDGTTFANIQRNYSLEVLQVKSVGNHLSVGMTGSVGSSTFTNQRRVMRLAPAIEYDLFPYDQSARRQLTVQYAAGVADYHYVDTTIFLKTRETVPVHSLRAVASAQQPWGDLSVTALVRTQLDDATKRRATLGGNAEVRLVQGLSLQMSGNISSINDQIYLAREGASDEEILVQQRERATSYEFRVSFGLSYTFGSIFNNVVNPRFASIDFF
jgi:hypothetical protein